MEQRILPPDLEDPPRPQRQWMAALAFAAFVLASVALIVWVQA